MAPSALQDGALSPSAGGKVKLNYAPRAGAF